MHSSCYNPTVNMGGSKARDIMKNAKQKSRNKRKMSQRKVILSRSARGNNCYRTNVKKWPDFVHHKPQQGAQDQFLPENAGNDHLLSSNDAGNKIEGFKTYYSSHISL